MEGILTCADKNNHIDRKKVNPDIAAFTSLKLFFFSIFHSFKTSSWNGYQPVFSYRCQIGFLTADFLQQSRSSVYASIMEEKLTRVQPHCLAIHTKDKRQNPSKKICICELLSSDL